MLHNFYFVGAFAKPILRSEEVVRRKTDDFVIPPMLCAIKREYPEWIGPPADNSPFELWVGGFAKVST